MVEKNTDVADLFVNWKLLQGHEVMAIIASETVPTVMVKGVVQHMPDLCDEPSYMIKGVENHIHIGAECFIDAYTVWGVIVVGDVFGTFEHPDPHDTSESVKVSLDINYQGGNWGYDEAVRITVE